MSENEEVFNSQLALYTQKKKLEYERKLGAQTKHNQPTTAAFPVFPETLTGETEQTRLVQQQPRIIRDSSLSGSGIPSRGIFNGGSSSGADSSWDRPRRNCFDRATSSVKVCTLPVLGGVPLHIHYLWPVFLLLTALAGLQVSPIYALYSFILGGPILFGTVLLHELGHATMAVRCGGSVSRILLWPLGGLAYISLFGESDPKADALVAIAGPLTHIPQIAVWAAVMYLSNHGDVELNWELQWGYDFWVSLCAGAIGIQISLFLFNLIPAYPLDGGRLLGAWLAYSGADQNRVIHITSIIGMMIGFFLFFHSMGVLGTSNGSFFIGWNSLMLAVFIIYSSCELYSMAANHTAMHHIGFQPAHPSGSTTSSHATGRFSGSAAGGNSSALPNYHRLGSV